MRFFALVGLGAGAVASLPYAWGAYVFHGGDSDDLSKLSVLFAVGVFILSPAITAAVGILTWHINEHLLSRRA